MPMPGYKQSPEHKKKRLSQIEDDGNGRYKDGRRSYRRKAGAKPNDGTIVHHKNGDRSNNSHKNLERLSDGKKKPGRRTTPRHEQMTDRFSRKDAIDLAIRNDRLRNPVPTMMSAHKMSTNNKKATRKGVKAGTLLTGATSALISGGVIAHGAMRRTNKDAVIRNDRGKKCGNSFIPSGKKCQAGLGQSVKSQRETARLLPKPTGGLPDREFKHTSAKESRSGAAEAIGWGLGGAALAGGTALALTLALRGRGKEGADVTSTGGPNGGLSNKPDDAEQRSVKSPITRYSNGGITLHTKELKTRPVKQKSQVIPRGVKGKTVTKLKPYVPGNQETKEPTESVKNSSKIRSAKGRLVRKPNTHYTHTYTENPAITEKLSKVSSIEKGKLSSYAVGKPRKEDNPNELKAYRKLQKDNPGVYRKRSAAPKKRKKQ